MKLIIHRGANQVGGSCIELSHEDYTILMDLGLPLDSNFDDDMESRLPQPLFNEIRQGNKKIKAVLLSHAHVDHFGLIGMLPDEIPIYTGQASADLINLTQKVSYRPKKPIAPIFFENRKTFFVGPFAITPYRVDHSAFDSYAFLVSAGGKNIFYSGDFRAHGRLTKIFDKLISDPPKVDVLLMEGTMVGSRCNELSLSERKLEEKFVQLIQETPGIVMISTSSQNIDRLVTIFKATMRSQRLFIIDFYTAEILETVGKYAKIPQAYWPRIRVCYPNRLETWFKMLGLSYIPEKHRQNVITWTRLRELEDKAVILIRPNFTEVKKSLSLEDATWIYSMWPGYCERDERLKDLRNYFQGKGVRIESLHTGGHAKIPDLARLTQALKPEVIIPVHSFHAEKFKEYFTNVKIVKDVEAVSID
ncbi:MAG TPA: MBL fold metallo-hydrolase [Smithella sp.]|nr:MBL fold metallo-hydrolase [Smithella sp.]HOG91601.1 MBL fold metallo-hydrolase [Smithella sp.]